MSDEGKTVLKGTANINAYLGAAPNIEVVKRSLPLSSIGEMTKGNQPTDGGHLLLSRSEADEAIERHRVDRKFLRPLVGSQEFIQGKERYCLWITDKDYIEVSQNAWLHDRFEAVRKQRSSSNKATTRQLANMPYRFGEIRQTGSETVVVIPRVSSENRQYLPVGLLSGQAIIGDQNFALYDAPLWNMALLASRIHLVWIATVCGKLETRFRYSNTLGWNTFPVPKLTGKNRADLTRCAEDILLAREAHFPATIADLYKPDAMPENLRAAHDRNDEVLERIYIGRLFRNDTERLEKLFELYTRMTTEVTAA